MNKPTPSTRSKSKWFWILTLLALLILAILWLLNPFGRVEDAPPPQTTGQATSPQTTDPSTEWVPAPEEPGIDVTLPETPVTNAPAPQTQETVD